MPDQIPKMPLVTWQEGIVEWLKGEHMARVRREKRIRNALVIGAVVVAVAFGALAVVQLVVLGRQSGANRALCTFRADLARRVDLTERFIKDHPKGIPGIPAGTLRVSLSNQRLTVRSLAELHC